MIVIHYLFLGYSLLIIARIFSSWIPQLANSSFMRPIYVLTEPYLALFRKIIPPIGGTIDLSPMVALFVLHFIERIFFSIIA